MDTGWVIKMWIDTPIISVSFIVKSWADSVFLRNTRNYFPKKIKTPLQSSPTPSKEHRQSRRRCSKVGSMTVSLSHIFAAWRKRNREILLTYLTQVWRTHSSQTKSRLITKYFKALKPPSPSPVSATWFATLYWRRSVSQQELPGCLRTTGSCQRPTRMIQTVHFTQENDATTLIPLTPPYTAAVANPDRVFITTFMNTHYCLSHTHIFLSED